MQEKQSRPRHASFVTDTLSTKFVSFRTKSGSLSAGMNNLIISVGCSHKRVNEKDEENSLVNGEMFGVISHDG